MSKRGIVLYLHVHQPWRVKPYSVFDIASDHEYFDGQYNDTNNEAIMQKVANKSYRPMNEVLETLLNKYPDFKVSLSITGTFIEQAERWAPDVIESFKRLVATGKVDIVAETYHHSLAFFFSRTEFETQVKQHAKKIKQLFGVTPTVFRNTELAYNDELAKWADEAGYKAILAEGWGPVLGWRSPNYVYQPPDTKAIKLLLKNYKLSDDVAFRFSDKQWSEFPLMADTYKNWLDASIDSAPLVNLFMDYETFGEHQWADTGIFSFFEQFVEKWLQDENNTFYTTSQAADNFEAVDVVSAPRTITWADTERDLTAWLGNSMQHEAMRHLYALEDGVVHSGDERLIHDWRMLQTSDHAYYMCTKWFRDGDVHAYFSPYDSPYDAFLYFMNAIRDIRYRLMADQSNGVWHG
jgi:alpha-amylase